MDCLKMCCIDGWRPRWLSESATDLVFLAKVTRGRVVDRGRIMLKNIPYEHDAMITLHSQRVDVRFDPMDPEWVLIFQNGEFICCAEPVEHSSMKDNFSGTDAKNSDFRKSTLAEDYSVGAWEIGKLGSFDVYIMELEALHNEVTYPTKKAWVTLDNNLVLKTEDYSLTGRLMRTSLFPKYARLGESMIPVNLIFVDELVDGNTCESRLSVDQGSYPMAHR